MATKKPAKKEEEIVKEEAPKKGRYIWAIGRRKTAIAKIKLYPAKGNQNTYLINDRKIEEYFPAGRIMDIAKDSMALAGQNNKFEVIVKISGGGVNAQAEAMRMGIARALVIFDAELKKSLKDKGYLTRDSREVERKKPGLKKARRAPQWAKR
jgi:small subunit ribosomal protein S9